MKRILYLLAFVALAFSACTKLPVVPLYPAVASKVSLTVTLAPADYALLPSTDYPSTKLSFNNAADAEMYIPTILSTKYAKTAADGSTAVVTYTQSPLSFTSADSTFADVAYTLTTADYALLPGNKYTDFSIAQVLSWLPYKFPSPVNNTLKLLTFTPYPATLTPPYSFLYTNGSWREIYTITPAEYTALGLGKYDQFTSANDATLPSTLSALVKTDLTVQDTIKAGDIEYISFNYYGADKGTYQKVIALQYDGSNYVAPKTSIATLNFQKTAGAWKYVQPLPVISYTLTAADIKLISNSTFSTAANRTNLASYGDFEPSWATADLQSAFILCLTADFPAPVTNTIYRVHYKLYTGGTDVDSTLDFEWTGTTWIAK